MNKHLQTIEYDKVLQMVADRTSFPQAQELALSLRPAGSRQEAEELLQETSDACRLSGGFGAPPFGNLRSVENALRRAQAGAVLTTLELLRVASVLHSIRSVLDWRDHSEGIETVLDRYFNLLSPQKFLETKITASILSEEEIADSASPTLQALRRKIAREEANIRERLDKMIRSPSTRKFLQEAIITQRNGRFVLPVKAECRSSVAGLVHDTSASGSTVFIEPMSVVEANNDIRVLRSKETAEIERILAELSAEAGAYADPICESCGVMTHLNVIFAKAELAFSMKASVPELNEEGIVFLRQARHPLIPSDKVVPTDIRLGEDFDTLVITGPNTGGKTVALKTLGLLTAMAMSGLLIPAGDHSRVAVFGKILADIGDEQSIEQSLSTFSAHMTNIISLLRETDENSLVLIDELGAGTDPVEGAALARSILEQLRRQGGRLAATTHYAELKSYALETDGVENACCEFDVNTLRPTYRLLIGMPGRSNAFAISRRLGMPQEIVDRASELVSGEDSRFEQVVSQLEETRSRLEQEQQEAERLNRTLREQEEEAREQAQKNREEQAAALEDARRQAQDIIAKARTQVYSLLDELEALKKQKEVTAAQRAGLRAAIRSMENEADPVDLPQQDDYVLPRPLKPGDRVLIVDLNKEAVVEEVRKGTVLVQAGLMKSRVPVASLRLLEPKKTPPPRSAVRTVRSEEHRAASEVDVRGQTAMDAILEVDKALDAALMQGLHQVTIIHGKGTGVLRREIQAHLKKHPMVRSFRLGVYGEGDSGVTIAELKGS